MSRFLLLFLFLLWMSWPPGPGVHPASMRTELTLFLGLYALIVLVMGLWSRLLARRVTGSHLHRDVRRFNKVMFNARLAVLAWFGVGVFTLGWGSIVQWMLGPVADWPLQLPGTLLGTAPALAAWAGLWWAQFPADRALREQSLLIALDEGVPIHSPPRFGKYLVSNLRLQVLFSAVPVLLILAIHDVVVSIMWATGLLNRPGFRPDLVEGSVSIGSALLVFLFAPVILRRVLHTQRLPDSPLRRRLEALCERNRLRYREILLWHTENNMGNAAVMGVFPRVRYILLSDLLLETMTDAQIEAVFAHEVGHVVHRHMAWYGVFFVVLILLMAGPGELFARFADEVGLPPWLPLELLMTVLFAAVFLLAFGFLSRRFERQADVFAARTMEAATLAPFGSTIPPAGAVASAVAATAPPRSHVGRHGASLFASALHRVAVVNNIPVAARSWCHGSIAKRMQYLHELSTDPARTAHFDRFMTRLYAALLIALVVGGAWAAVMLRG